MTRREALDRMALLGAGMVMSPFHHAAQAAQDPRQRLLAQVGALPEPEQKVRALKPMRYVVVTLNGPDDGGDFGKSTPGTRTSGLQEAFDYAKENGRNVFICGTSAETPADSGPYVLEETLHIPWRHSFRCDGEVYCIAGPPTGDAVWIDSQMCCRLWIAHVSCGSRDGACVRIDPRTAGPDGWAGTGAASFEFGSMWGGAIGLWLDASGGPILGASIECNEINVPGKGIYMSGTHGVQSNSIRCVAMGNFKVGIQMGDSETPSANYHRNRIEAYVGPQSPAGSVGVRVFGQRNVLTLDIDRQAPGEDIVFEAEARDNLIIAQNPPVGITNNARVPTNRIITLTPVGFDVPTPPIPASGEDVVNREPYPVDVIIREPGAVSEWVLTDPNGKAETVTAGLSAGQRFVLDPGDRIRFTYSAPPSWRWKALS